MLLPLHSAEEGPISAYLPDRGISHEAQVKRIPANVTVIRNFDGDAVEGRKGEEDEVAVSLEIEGELREVLLFPAAFEPRIEYEGSGPNPAGVVRQSEELSAPLRRNNPSRWQVRRMRGRQ